MGRATANGCTPVVRSLTRLTRCLPGQRCFCGGQAAGTAPADPLTGPRPTRTGLRRAVGCRVTDSRDQPGPPVAGCLPRRAAGGSRGRRAIPLWCTLASRERVPGAPRRRGPRSRPRQPQPSRIVDRVPPPSQRTPRPEALLAERLGELTVRDEHRLRRRLDRLRTTREPAQRAEALARLPAEFDEAQARIERRRAALPPIDYP